MQRTKQFPEISLITTYSWLNNYLEGPKVCYENYIKMFKENLVKANPKNSQFVFLGKTPRQLIILNIIQLKIKESQKIVLIGLPVE